MKIHAVFDILNLPNKLNGKYIVVRRIGSETWFYGCYSDKEKAQQAVYELNYEFVDDNTVAFMIERT